MQVQKTNIEGLLVLSPKIFGDERGYFFESFNREVFQKATNTAYDFVQDNESKSKSNVLRGLHFQAPPYDQGKLIRVSNGSVLDVVVDIRLGSNTYGQFFSRKLDATKKEMLWVPPGMAHGFVSLEDDTVFNYKCTNYYHPESEGCILWNDKDLSISWGVSDPVISGKDQQGVAFKDFITPFR